MRVVFRAHDEILDRERAFATVHGYDTQQGLDSLMMEYSHGTTVSKKLDDGALPGWRF